MSLATPARVEERPLPLVRRGDLVARKLASRGGATWVVKDPIALRYFQLGAEEGWVDDPRDAWWLQSELLAHTGSFLTRAHDLHRLRWMLSDVGDAKANSEVVKFLAALAAAKTLKRAELVALADALAKEHKSKTPKLARWTDAAAKLSPKARPLAVQAGLAKILGLEERPTEKATRELAEAWRPHRGSVAILTWHCYNNPAL